MSNIYSLENVDRDSQAQLQMCKACVFINWRPDGKSSIRFISQLKIRENQITEHDLIIPI